MVSARVPDVIFCVCSAHTVNCPDNIGRYHQTRGVSISLADGCHHCKRGESIIIVCRCVREKLLQKNVYHAAGSRKILHSRFFHWICFDFCHDELEHVDHAIDKFALVLEGSVDGALHRTLNVLHASKIKFHQLLYRKNAIFLYAGGVGTDLVRVSVHAC